MKTIRLSGNQKVYCLKKMEAIFLNQHIQEYLDIGIDLKDHAVVVDVGANIGLLGIRYLQQFPNSTIYAFEPIPQIFKVLEANAAQFPPNRFKVFQLGIADKAAIANFSYYPQSPALSTAFPEVWEQQPQHFTEAVVGSIKSAPMAWAKWFPTQLAPLASRILRSNPQKVEAQLKTLSQALANEQIDQIDLLKIDCEGAELACLQGISEADWPKIRQIVGEIYDEDNRVERVIQLLKSKGFANTEIIKSSSVGRCPLFNFIALKP